jgi:N-acetylmuramic acid 6-phosphate etherase
MYRRWVEQTDFSFLAGFTGRESAIYAGGDCVTYRVRDYGITVFTDTTERAPTFSLVPFDQLRKRAPRHSLCYIALDEADNGTEAWRALLNREPRPLEWNEVDPRTSERYLRKFDFGRSAVERRAKYVPGSSHHEFTISGTEGGIAMSLGGLDHTLATGDLPALLRHTLLKQALNIHSTLVMGRLGRYQGNLMTWVRPTNGKLVDRAARYVHHLLVRDGHTGIGYDTIVRRIFQELANAPPDEPIVLRTLNALKLELDPARMNGAGAARLEPARLTAGRPAGLRSRIDTTS